MGGKFIQPAPERRERRLVRGYDGLEHRYGFDQGRVDRAVDVAGSHGGGEFRRSHDDVAVRLFFNEHSDVVWDISDIIYRLRLYRYDVDVVRLNGRLLRVYLSHNDVAFDSRALALFKAVVEDQRHAIFDDERTVDLRVAENRVAGIVDSVRRNTKGAALFHDKRSRLFISVVI